MAKTRITRRQKNISRLLREKKQIYRDKLKSHRDKCAGRSNGDNRRYNQ